MALGLDLAFEPVRHDILSCKLAPPPIREAVEENPADWVEGTVLVVVSAVRTAGFSLSWPRILTLIDPGNGDHARSGDENDLWPSEPRTGRGAPIHPDKHPLHTELCMVWRRGYVPVSGDLVTEVVRLSTRGCQNRWTHR